MLNKILSLILILFYLITAFIYNGIEGFLRTFLFVLLPFACIWFGNSMGMVTGQKITAGNLHPTINKSSPGCLLILAGWILLLSPFIFAFFMMN